MNKFLLRPLLLIAFCAVCVTASFGQITPKMLVGETLTYEGKLSKVIQGISVGELTLNVIQDPGSSNLIIKTNAVSKGTLIKLFRYSFLENYQSFVDGDTFRIIRTTKHDEQKERVRDSIADFDYNAKRVTYTETDPKDPNRPPRNIASDIGPTMNDLISAIYSLRMMPLVVGHEFDVQVSDSGLVYTVPVHVTARELQKSILGRVWCYRVEPAVFGPDRMIEQSGKLVIWIADERRRIPVRARIDTEWGKIEVRLKSADPVK